MPKEKTNTTKLGIFVITALLLFAFGVYKIGDKQNLFGSTFQISSVFKNVSGLQPGNNVRFSGINVGSVKEIVILNGSTLQVNMALEKNMQRFLKKDATATIGTDGLVGNMIINISPGKGEETSVEEGDFIDSYTRPGTEAMLSKLNNTNETVALLTLNLLEVVEKVNKGNGSVATLINDNALTNDLQLAIQNLRTTTEHVNALSRQLDNSMNQVNEGQGVLGYLLKDTTFKSKINLTVNGLDSLIRNRTVPIMRHLETSSKDLATTTSELKKITEQIDLNNSLAGTLLTDSLVSEELKITLLNLKEGSALMKEDLEALQHSFLLRGAMRRMERKRGKEEKKEGDLVVKDSFD